MNEIQQLQYVIDFTNIYKQYSAQNKAIREIKCLEKQLEHILQPIGRDDLVVGFMKHGLVGFSPQYGGIYTYFFHKDRVLETLGKIRHQVDDCFVNQINEIIDFWGNEATENRVDRRFYEKYGFVMPKAFTEPGLANAGTRLAGMNVNLDKLILLGLPGLRDEISEAEFKAERDGDQEKIIFYQSLNMSIDLICKACDFYINNARELLCCENDVRRETQLSQIIETLQNIKCRKPQSFREGLQLFWIYAVVSDLMNYGRMDVYLGDLYCNDIDNGVLTEEEAIDLLSSVWRHFIRIGKVHDCRVIVGGKGRRNEQNADRLALVIMEVSRRIKDVVPQLTLRYYCDMDKRLLDKALGMLSEGYCFPIIYSDDTNIPAVMKAYDVTEEEAGRYIPFGCGEYVLEGLSTGTPNNGINLLKALELVLHNGYDKIWDMQLEEAYGGLEKLDTFDKLFLKYCGYVERNVELLAVQKKMNYDAAGEQASYLFYSLLMEDCIQKGKALLDGGVRYLNASSEIFGMISCADSLSAIKKLVFDEHKFTLKQVVEMLDCDFEGYEKERKLFINCPKYGNDNDYADGMAQKVFNHIAEATINAGKKAGLNKYLIVSVNNSMSAEWGKFCLASACGRKKGDPMSNGNGASIGADRKGLTALLNSMSKFDNSKHVGVINNIRVTKRFLNDSVDKFKILIETFFQNNGVQLNICCIGGDDLEKAMVEPEKYRNIIVRIGGFSARFVELSPVVQNEIIRRTTYEC